MPKNTYDAKSFSADHTQVFAFQDSIRKAMRPRGHHQTCESTDATRSQGIRCPARCPPVWSLFWRSSSWRPMGFSVSTCLNFFLTASRASDTHTTLALHHSALMIRCELCIFQQISLTKARWYGKAPSNKFVWWPDRFRLPAYYSLVDRFRLPACHSLIGALRCVLIVFTFRRRSIVRMFIMPEEECVCNVLALQGLRALIHF